MEATNYFSISNPFLSWRDVAGLSPLYRYFYSKCSDEQHTFVSSVLTFSIKSNHCSEPLSFPSLSPFEIKVPRKQLLPTNRYVVERIPTSVNKNTKPVFPLIKQKKKSVLLSNFAFVEISSSFLIPGKFSSS